MSRPPLSPRGTTVRPPSRFEPLRVERDPDEQPDGREPTRFFRDASKSILSENDSPDVGFRFGINPYRGCEHGCTYCLSPDTPVLHADMTWRPIGEVRVGDALLGFDEHPAPGTTRKFRRSVVEAVWWSRKPTVRIVTEHAEVVTTAEHRWLQARDFRWSRTAGLVPGRRLRHVPVTPTPPPDEDYRLGYVAGLSRGDGTFRWQPGWRSDTCGFPAAYWRVALADHGPLERLVEYLRGFGVDAGIRPFDGGPTSRKPMRKVEVRSLARLAVVHGLLHAERDTAAWRRGFLAGFFDAEGHDGTSLRMAQRDFEVLERVRRYAAALGFRFQLEPRPGAVSTLRLVGRMADRIRFFSTIRPAIARKMQALFGREMNVDPEPVRAIESGRPADVVDIQTSTRTFWAAGLATHNCYARPSHEYLGFDAGLGFESRIMVKEDAPALLRKALSSRRWEPQPIALSGNTDCYQPVERRLGITRRCLEVLAEFRNPVTMITKSALVARDADVLASLAAVGAVHVSVSVTSLDPELARRMEPRASQPARRLEAIAALAAARIPVALMIGPVIPGLNDEEIPRIIAAAAAAGAVGAHWVLLRLPPPVDRLVDDWLATHYPDRRKRVLGRIRATRGGRTSDARFGVRQRGEGEHARQIAALFDVAARKHGLHRPLPPLRTDAFRRPAKPGDQLALL